MSADAPERVLGEIDGRGYRNYLDRSVGGGFALAIVEVAYPLAREDLAAWTKARFPNTRVADLTRAGDEPIRALLESAYQSAEHAEVLIVTGLEHATNRGMVLARLNVQRDELAKEFRVPWIIMTTPEVALEMDSRAPDLVDFARIRLTEDTPFSQHLMRLDAETRWFALPFESATSGEARMELDEILVTPRVQIELGPREISFIEAVRQRPFFVLLGDPGAGKTTLLHYLARHTGRALRGSEESRTKLGLGRESLCAIPLLIPCREIATRLSDAATPDLEGAVVAWAASLGVPTEESVLREAIRSRRVLLLLDGLDAVVEPMERPRLVQAVQQTAAIMATIDGPGGIVVTSRPMTYHSEARLGAPFEVAWLLDLDRREIHHVLEGWVRATHEVPSGAPISLYPEAERALLGAKAALSSSRNVEQLCKNPLMLMILMLVQHREGRLPAQRVVLYDQMVSVLLRRIGDHPGYKPSQVRACLADVARRFMEEAIYQARGAEVIQMIADRLGVAPREAAVIYEQVLRTGIWQTDDAGRCRFAHLAFQEYLAARWLADGLSEPEMHSEVERHLGEPRWRETLKMLAGILASRSPSLVKRLFEHLVGPNDQPQGERVRRVAAVAMLREDAMGFDMPPSVME